MHVNCHSGMGWNGNQRSIPQTAGSSMLQVRKRHDLRPARQTLQIRLIMFSGSRSSADVTEMRITMVICRAGRTGRGGEGRRGSGMRSGGGCSSSSWPGVA